MPRRCLVWIVPLIAAGAVVGAAEEEPLDRDRSKGRRIMVPGFSTQAAYYFLPDDFDKRKTYKLFFAFRVHSSMEEQGFGWGSFANEADCIVAAMNLASGGDWYYTTYRRDKPHQRVASMYKALGKRFSLSTRMFIATEGYGARVMQEFAMAYPKRVYGIAIHDPDNLVKLKWDTPKIPTLVTVSANSSWSMWRVERFLQKAKQFKYNCIYFQTVPGYCDQEEGRARALVTEFYKRSIGSPDVGVPKEAVKQYDKAAELLKIGEYAEAAELLRPIAASSKTGDYRKRARKLLGTIDGLADKQLEAAAGVAAADKAKAAAMYREILKKFRGTSGAERAEAELKKLGLAAVVPADKPDKPDEPPTPPVESKDEQLAQALLDQAEKLLAQGQRDKALQCLRAAAIHGDTRAGEKAAARLKQLAETKEPTPPTPPNDKPDEPKKPDDVAAKCEKWLALARNYMANRRYAQAKGYLRRIIRTSPDSRHADEARELLAKCNLH